MSAIIGDLLLPLWWRSKQAVEECAAAQNVFAQEGVTVPQLGIFKALLRVAEKGYNW